MEIKVIGSKSAIYPTGGGNWITEAGPTMFHHQWKEKILTDMETPEMYKEVTQSQWNTIAAADAGFAERGEGVRTAMTPMFEHLGAVFNDATGYYEMNDLYDLTEADMMEVAKWAPIAAQTLGCQSSTIGYNTSKALSRCSARTLPVIWVNRSGGTQNWSYAFDSTALQSVIFGTNNAMRDKYIYHYGLGFPRSCFWNSQALRIVRGLVFKGDYNDDALYNIFISCKQLKILECYELNNSLSLASSPNLTIESVEHLIRNRYGEVVQVLSNAGDPKPITLTLHPTAYARITPELFALAAEKQITIASA